MITLPQFKRGSTFALLATITDSQDDPIDAPIDNLKAQIRDKADRLVSDLDIVNTGMTGEYTLTTQDINTWIPGRVYKLDIRYTDGVNISYTDTLEFTVVSEVTRIE